MRWDINPRKASAIHNLSTRYRDTKNEHNGHNRCNNWFTLYPSPFRLHNPSDGSGYSFSFLMASQLTIPLTYQPNIETQKMSTETPDPEIIPGQEDDQLSMQWGEQVFDVTQDWAGDQYAWNPWQWDALDAGC